MLQVAGLRRSLLKEAIHAVSCVSRQIDAAVANVSIEQKRSVSTSKQPGSPELSQLKERRSWSPLMSDLVQTVLPKGSRRTGVIAVKVGMTQEWDQWGQRVPLTVLWIDDCEVVQTKTVENEGYCSVQLGVGAKRDKQLDYRQIGHFKAAGVPNKRKLFEFRVSPDGLLPPQTKITAAHFTPGQYVDVQGTTLGKGFQGVMKRWGFAGQPATHGNSKAHRAAGGIGACQDPGKVWPGKKMPGRMGGKTRSVLSAYLYKVDPQRNLLYVKGQVPGHKGNFVVIKDAVKKTHDVQPERPFPTFLNGLPDSVIYAPKAEHNPFEKRDR